MPFATSYRESLEVVRLAFAVTLTDRYARSPRLEGDVTVKAGKVLASRKGPDSGTFTFLQLVPGPYSLVVESDRWTPYYRPASIPVVVPAVPAVWPAYPDITLADPTLPLDDGGQTAPFIAQYRLAALLPTAQYPFDGSATLVRGTVFTGGARLKDATVSVQGGSEIPYLTRDDGEFVLFFESPAVTPQLITVRASHAGMADQDVNVTIVRGSTAVATIDM